MNSYRLSHAALAMAVAMLVACGRKDTSRTDSADAADPADTVAEASATTPAPSSSPTTTPLAGDDIDRWQRGMAAELEAVHEAAANLKSAKTGEDTLSSMMAMQDMSTSATGAKYLRFIIDRYYSDSTITPLDRELFAMQASEGIGSR